MLKKIFAVLLAFTVLFSTISPANAQVWYNQSYDDWKMKVFDTKNDTEMFGERYTYAQVQWIVYSLLALVTSSILNNNSEMMICLSANSEDVIDASECTTGVLKFIEDLGGEPPPLEEQTSRGEFPPAEAQETKGFWDYMLADKGISAVSYVRELGNKLTLIPQAQAQDNEAGYGYNALSPIKNIWTQMRNASYALFALISVVFAFMIMFRVKISPQAVITVQSALPKLVLTVILVTFSYAIAGLVVDMMYLVIGVLSLVFNPFRGATGSTAFSFVLLRFMNGDIPIIPGDLTIFIYFFIWAVLTFLTMLVSILGMIATLNLNGAIYGILALIVIVFIGIWTIVWALKTTWILFKAAVTFLVLVMFAPLQLTLGAIVPSIGFGTWIRQLVANLAVFPVVGVLFLLAYYFLLAAMLDAAINLGALGGLTKYAFQWICMAFAGPVGTYLDSSGAVVDYCSHDNTFSMTISDLRLPFLGNIRNYMSMFYVMISIVLVSMIPKSAEMIKSLIEGKFAYGTALGEAMAPFKWGGQAISAQAQKYAGTKIVGTPEQPGVAKETLDKVQRGGGPSKAG